MRTGLREFWRGLTKPSLPALLLTFAVPLMGGGICAWWLDEDLIESDAARYLAASPGDQYLFLTQRALRLSKQRDQLPDVVILGASGSDHAITSAEQLAGMIGRDGRARPAVLRLESDDQSVLESLALIELIPPEFDGVILAEVSNRRLSRGITSDEMSRGRLRYRLGVRTEVYEQAARAAGIELEQWSNYFLDNQHFLLPRVQHLMRNLVHGPVHEAPNIALEARARLEAKWDRRQSWPKLSAERWRQRRATHQELYGDGYLERSQECLAAYVRAAQSRPDAVIVLFECPVSPRGIEEVLGRTFYDNHTRRMAELAHRFPLHYWNLNDEMGFAESDFRDWVHLQCYSSQRRFTEALAGRVDRLLASRRRSPP